MCTLNVFPENGWTLFQIFLRAKTNEILRAQTLIDSPFDLQYVWDFFDQTNYEWNVLIFDIILTDILEKLFCVSSLKYTFWHGIMCLNVLYYVIVVMYGYREWKKCDIYVHFNFLNGITLTKKWICISTLFIHRW